MGKSAWGQLLSSRSSGYLTRVLKDSYEPFRDSFHLKMPLLEFLSLSSEIPYDGLEKTLLWRLISGKIQVSGLWFSGSATAFWAFDKANPRCFCNHQPRTWAMTFLYVLREIFHCFRQDSSSSSIQREKRAGVMCRDFSRNDTLSVCIRHRFWAELWWRQFLHQLQWYYSSDGWQVIFESALSENAQDARQSSPITS